MVKIDKGQSGMWMHGKIAERVVHAVADVVRNQEYIARGANKAWAAATMAGVYPAIRMRTRNEQRVGISNPLRRGVVEGIALLDRGDTGLLTDLDNLPALNVLRTVGECLVHSHLYGRI